MFLFCFLFVLLCVALGICHNVPLGSKVQWHKSMFLSLPDSPVHTYITTLKLANLERQDMDCIFKKKKISWGCRSVGRTPASMCKPRVPSPPLHKSGLLICASNPITQEDKKGGSEVQSIGWGDGSEGKVLAVHARGSKFKSPESKYSWELEHASLIKVPIRQEARCRQENPWVFTGRSACKHSI